MLLYFSPRCRIDLKDQIGVKQAIVTYIFTVRDLLFLGIKTLLLSCHCQNGMLIFMSICCPNHKRRDCEVRFVLFSLFVEELVRICEKGLIIFVSFVDDYCN